MRWLKVTVRTTTEGSDFVSQLMIDAGAAGTQIEDKADIVKNQRPEGQWDIIDESIALKMSEDVLVSAYYPIDARLTDTLANIRQRIALAPRDEIPMGSLVMETGEIDEEDWAEYWKKDYKPFRLGSHIVIKPGWERFEPLEGDKIIEIDPGMAFGTGTHETTALCVALIEEYMRPGMSVIDIGTGTGILAIAAAHMGASGALATDIDPVAVRVAAENVRLNGFAGVIRVAEGDLLKAVGENADLVIANIIADVIVMIAAPVKAHINAGGLFICSGIAREKKDAVLEALKSAGYGAPDVREKGEWCAIAAARDA